MRNSYNLARRHLTYELCSYLPVAAVTTHGLGIIVLTALIVHGLYQSYRNLPPAQGTRERRSRRSIYTPLFAGLALGSLALAGHSASKYVKLSYQAWAHQRSIDIPARYVQNNTATLIAI